jgi:aryl-alcohol dehydrogenase-like predicted oxidoreductase
MEQRRVGTTDLMLSVIGLGGAWLGHEPGEPADIRRAAAVMNAAAAAGSNWVDTSENYFDTGNESVIGPALRDVSQGVLVCSKAAPGALYSGGGSGFRPEQIRSACQGSLERLGLDHLDLYLLHWPDETGVPLADTWAAMAQLVDDGLVRAVGLSNYEREDIAACHAQRPVDLIQTGLSVIDYLEDRELIAWCGTQNIAVTIYDPLAGGLLTDKPFDEVRGVWVGTDWEQSSFFQRLLREDKAAPTKRVVDGLHDVAADLGVTTAQVALAWLLRQPGVTSAIPGTTNPERAASNAGAGDLTLPDNVLEIIEGLIPLGPAFT